MDKALIVINEQSGGYTDRVKTRIQAATEGYERHYIDIDGDLAKTLDEGGFGLLAVAGGDGTLRSVLNKTMGHRVDLTYVPCGTLNERAKARRRFGNEGKLVLGHIHQNPPVATGKMNAKDDESSQNSDKHHGECEDFDKPISGAIGENNRERDGVYTYVLAAGSFTPIGYVTSVRAKKRYGRIAYLAKVLSEYRVHAIRATVTIDGTRQTGEYTLIMSVKSDRCFGFRFNKTYRPDTQNGHILLIKSPKNKGFWGKICMFFPFFRAFFVGFRRPLASKRMTFVPYSTLSINLDEACDFDVDGEKVTLDGSVDLSFADYPNAFAVRY